MQDLAKLFTHDQYFLIRLRFRCNHFLRRMEKIEGVGENNLFQPLKSMVTSERKRNKEVYQAWLSSFSRSYGTDKVHEKFQRHSNMQHSKRKQFVNSQMAYEVNMEWRPIEEPQMQRTLIYPYEKLRRCCRAMFALCLISCFQLCPDLRCLLITPTLLAAPTSYKERNRHERHELMMLPTPHLKH